VRSSNGVNESRLRIPGQSNRVCRMWPKDRRKTGTGLQ
jgi:hypothetical protein